MSEQDQVWDPRTLNDAIDDHEQVVQQACAEIDRLRAINADLLAACEAVDRELEMYPWSAIQLPSVALWRATLRAAIAKAKGVRP